jgi:tRNA-binding protein
MSNHGDRSPELFAKASSKGVHMAVFSDFEKLDIRVGRVVEVEEFPEARKASYRLKIDFGPEIGVKRSCGQFASTYQKEDLKGKLVLAVVNFPPRQIGPALSEVLTLGVPNEEGFPILVLAEREVPLGGKLF